MVFTGKAIPDAFDSEVAEIVARLIADISPLETPLLDAIGDADRSSGSSLFEWTNDALAPLEIFSLFGQDEDDTTLALTTSNGEQIPIGSVLFNYTTAEYVRVTSTTAVTLTIVREFNGSTGTSIATANTWKVQGGGVIEGADWEKDTSSNRSTSTNYFTLFKYDVGVTLQKQATTDRANVISDELAYQLGRKLPEALRNLESHVLLGKTSGATIGTDTVPPGMDGLKSQLTTNITSLGTFTRTVVDTFIKNCWDNGGTDIDLLVVGATKKQDLDNDILSIQRSRLPEDRVRQEIAVFESKWTNFPVRVILNRHLPPLAAMALSSQRLGIVPLADHTFRTRPIAPTGLTEKSLLYGMYTLMTQNEEGMAINWEY